MLEAAKNPQIRPEAAFRTLAGPIRILQTEQTEASTPPSIDELLCQMRTGSRDAAAEFLMRYGSRVRRRVRGKLGPTIRRLFDSMDILSTLGRRLDLYVMAGRFDAANETQMWTLLFKMADHALVDKARTVKAARSLEHMDGEFARQQTHRRLEAEEVQVSSADLEMEKYLAWVENPLDRLIFSRWLLGQSFVEIGKCLDLSEDAVRKRQKRAQLQMKERLNAAMP